MSDLKVISAKIPVDFFGKLEELRQSLAIETRQELIERALRLFLHTSQLSEKSYTSYVQPDQNDCLLKNTDRTDITEGQTSSKKMENSKFQHLSEEELLILFREADKPPAWMKQKVERICGEVRL